MHARKKLESFFLFYSKCIVYLNKIFGWKSFLSIILPFQIDSWDQEGVFCKHGIICITGLKFDTSLLKAFNSAQKMSAIFIFKFVFWPILDT